MAQGGLVAFGIFPKLKMKLSIYLQFSAQSSLFGDSWKTRDGSLGHAHPRTNKIPPPFPARPDAVAASQAPFAAGNDSGMGDHTGSV